MGAKGTRGAHVEHVPHVRDVGAVKAQRLVEGRRFLPSRRGGHAMRGERCEPGGERAWGVVAAHKRHARGKGPTQGLGAKGTRGAHAEHGVHGRDAGGVEAQRLWLKAFADCRVGGRACDAGGERGASREAGGPGVWWRHTRGMHGEKARLKAWGPRAWGTCRAHLEHVDHVCDAGGVKAQRLVEGRRALPSRREGMRCGGERCEPGGGRACGVVAAHKRHARGWPDARLGGQGHARSARRT